MAEAPITTEKLRLSEYMQLYAETGPFEIVDFERIFMPPQAPLSSRIAGRLFRRMADFVEENDLGEVFFEAPFVLIQSADWVKRSRVPDIMFIEKSRLKQLASHDPEWDTKPIPFVPDLAVEVVSPSDQFSAINQKIAEYLRDGVQLVWVIDPKYQTVTIHQSGHSLTQISTDNTLDGNDILNGFSLPLYKLFD